MVQVAVVPGIAALCALAHALHDGLRSEVSRALAILATGDGVTIGDYLRSYGVGVPMASLFLMLVQAMAAPVSTILVAFANGRTFGVVWGELLTDVARLGAEGELPRTARRNAAADDRQGP